MRVTPKIRFHLRSLTTVTHSHQYMISNALKKQKITWKERRKQITLLIACSFWMETILLCRYAQIIRLGDYNCDSWKLSKAIERVYVCKQNSFFVQNSMTKIWIHISYTKVFYLWKLHENDEAIKSETTSNQNGLHVTDFVFDSWWLFLLSLSLPLISRSRIKKSE